MKEAVILCVDDEDIVLRSLQRELYTALDDGYLIETAEGGEDALALFEELRAEGYDIPLVISDQIMPNLKGAELLSQIHARAPKTLKIMLTGQADMDAVTQAVNHAHLYRYIAKPWETADLVLTVKEALRSYFQDKQLEEQNQQLQHINASLEQQVRERTAVLEQQKIELEQKNRQLHELNANKDKFFSIIAHDLKSPFTSLIGYTDLLSESFEDSPPQEIKFYVTNLQTAAKKLYTLLENLLAWSRIQRDLLQSTPEPVDLYDVTRDNVELFSSNAKQKQIRLESTIPPKTVVFADYSMVNTVLRNLIANALKFTPAKGRVRISATVLPQSIETAVIDTGIGIPADALALLFRIDAHYTRHGTSGEEGSGLGLILCKELIEKNAGRIWVESRVGKGTCFKFTLPRPQP
jgi:two-component system, sensor histidine kinase and response regulator